MEKTTRKNMTEKQLANLNGVKNRKPKPVTENVPPMTEDEKKRTDWERNHAIITSEFIKLLEAKQKLPSYAELAKALNFDENTIRRHLADYSIDEFLNKLQIGNEAVLLNLFEQAATGKNAKVIELFLRCTGVLNNKLDITSGGKPLPNPQPMAGIVTLDPTKLPTDVLKAIIAQSEGTNL